MLTAVWHILTDDTAFHDLGGDYYAKHDPERALRRITRQANARGLTVRFEPIELACPELTTAPTWVQASFSDQTPLPAS
ncbi:hypothetical protein [Streptomyces mirabilis]